MESWYYLLVNASCILVPFLATFHPRFPETKRFYKRLLVAIPGMMLLFIPWDAVFTAQGVWAFNPNYVLGEYLAGLPLEEWFFFICIPFACLFTYECLRVFFPDLQSGTATHRLSLIIGLLFLVVALVFYDRAYTFWSHLLCAVLLFAQAFWIRGAYMARYYLMYVLIFPAFIASNGVLTGLQFWKYPLFHGSPELVTDQIVWYNNAENLGFRIFSVPLDDVSYGMLMLLLAITIFEGMKKKIPY